MLYCFLALGLLALASANDEYSESSEPRICYGDDECRGKQVCDMGTYICKDPTPSPETPSPTDPAGCCYGDSYKANGKCARATARDKCEDMGCHFLETNDPTECEMTTTSTPTTTEEAGCCKGDSYKTNAMCNNRLTRSQCERSSSCHFIKDGVVEDDCDFGTTEAPEDPGCCYGNPDIGYSKRWMESCTGYYTERDCTMLTNGDGEARCVWEPLGEYGDCSMLWPTTTTTTVRPGCCRGSSYKAQAKCVGIADQVGCERKDCEWVETEDADDCVITTTTTTTTTTTEEPGCCKADSKKREDMCLARDTREKCEKSSSCIEWISGKDADCTFQETTTEKPGCCYGNPDAAYSKRWMDQCTAYSTERECLMLTDDDGVARCVFEEMNEYEDCSMLWPTTTATPTEPAGCCRGSSYKAQAKCVGIEDQTGCERKDCEWLVTDDESDCVITTTSTTSTTETPGCCKGTSRTSNDACNDIEDAGQCDRRSSCTFIAFGILDIDCVFPATEPPEDPGCCYGNPDIAYSKRWNDHCKTFATQSECLMLTNDDGEPRCTFEPMGEYEDCETVWPTTTTTTEAAGCCRGSSYKAQDKCFGIEDQVGCERKDCEWLVTDDETDCVITTTSTTSTTETPGCCKGTSRTSNDACNAIDDADQCDRRSSCTFIAFGVLDEDCQFPATAPPEDPGCCYGNPDIAYSKRWMESCKTFGTEAECLMLTDGDGASRCFWEPLGEYEDCETVWPTTTTTTSSPAGCCYGDSYKANDKCTRAADEGRCQDMGCSWQVTDDPEDCEMTTTTPSPTTTTTTTPGCCDSDVSQMKFDKCNAKEDQAGCEKISDCFWVRGNDATCEPPVFTTTTPPTTTSTPAGCCRGSSYKAQDKCYGLEDQLGCERKDCEWVVTDDDSECDITTTTSSVELGCCAGTSAKNSDMCNEKTDRDSCERLGKCEFRVDELDCSWPTTTSEPWLGAQEDHQLPYNPHKVNKQSSRKGRHQEAMLFGGESAVSQAMDYQVSLSSLLLLAIAAFAVYQTYRWFAGSKGDKMVAPVQTQSGQYYQSA